MRSFKMSLLWSMYKNVQRQKKLKCIHLYNWSVLAAWIHPITKRSAPFFFGTNSALNASWSQLYQMALKIVKLCCRITQIFPLNCQFPIMNVSPIVPHLTLTGENKHQFNCLILFLSPTCGTFRALLSVSAFAWDTEWTKKLKVTW